MNRDEEQLRLLAIFHYVVAGIAALFSLFPIFHLVLGVFFVVASRKAKAQADAPPEFVGWLFIGLACFFILLGLTMAVMILISGRCLSGRRRYTLCQVLAGIECLFMPFGTILGVFTLVLLSRESVRALFGLPPRAAGVPRV